MNDFWGNYLLNIKREIPLTLFDGGMMLGFLLIAPFAMPAALSHGLRVGYETAGNFGAILGAVGAIFAIIVGFVAARDAALKCRSGFEKWLLERVIKTSLKDAADQ